jgi:hypothetical protein
MRFVFLKVLAAFVLSLTTSMTWSDELKELLQRQQAQISELERRLGEQERLLQRMPIVDQPHPAFESASYRDADFHGGEDCDCPSHFVGYDGGFFIRPYCPDATPFELKVNGRIQFRHTAFDRQAATFFDRASGMFVPIEERNDFEIERGRIAFGGFVHDPNLQFYLQIDLDTDDNHRAVAQDFWFNYEFSEAFNLYAGKAFIPGSRAWLDGALKMQFGDRSMATTFFRPDRTVGIWAIGNLTEDWMYRVMLGNGFQTADIAPAGVDDRFMVAGSTWWEPLADFGSGYSDIEHHEALAVRIGTSFAHASQEDKVTGTIPAEENFARLSDGVRLVAPGALAPGVTVNHFDIYLVSADLAAKYRGFSFNAEFYARWLDNFAATGPLPFSELYTDGFYFDTGYMICPETLELAGRISAVDGLFGDAWEYAGGVNIFFNGHNNKLTFDVTYLDGSPVTNTGANYRRGDRGVMFRSAWQVAF